MTFYFMMCSWLDGEDPNYYTHTIFQKLWVRNQMYWHEHHIADCLDY